MTVSSTTARQTYIGDGSLATYSYSFRIFDAGDLVLVKRNTSTGIETMLALTTDYTVTGAGGYNGGTFTLLAGVLPSGYELAAYRELDLLQSTDLRNQGTFLAEIHERVFDRLMMVNQQLQDQVNRSIRLPSSESTAILLPTKELRASKSLTFDVNGDPTASAPPSSGTISAPMQPVTAAATLAAARAAMGPWGDASVTATGGSSAISIADREGNRLNAKDFGADGGGVVSNSAIFAGIAAGKTVVVSSGTYRFSTDCTIVCDLDFRDGGKLSVDTGKTVTINGQVYAGNYQIFAGLGTIAGSLGMARINVYWFGAVSDGTGAGTGTDNKPAFTKVIALANAWSIGYFREVYLPAGNFAVDSRVDIPSGVKFNGEGPYSTNIYPKSGFNGGVRDPLGVLHTLEGGHGQPPGSITNLALSGNYGLPYLQEGIVLSANASSCRNVWLGGFGGTHLKCASTNQIVDAVIVDNGLVAQPTIGIEVVSPGVQVINCSIYMQQIGMFIHDIPTGWGKVPVQVIDLSIFVPYVGGYGILVRTTNAMPVRISDAVLMSDATTGYEAGGVYLQDADNTVVDNCLVEFPAACTAAQKGYVVTGTAIGVQLVNCSSKYCDYGVSCASSQVVIRGGRHAGHISYGIVVTAVAKTIVQDAVVAGPGVGVYMADGADNCAITGCIAFDCSTGFTIVQNAAAYNVLKNCHSVSTADLTVTGTAANLIKSGNTNRVGAI